jgi:magnesium-transporting ATPase (P-type)
MSIILKDLTNDKIIILCKGADSIIYPLLNNQKSELKEVTLKVKNKNKKKNLEKFAEEGLRTLIFAKGEIDEKEYNKWSDKYKQAKESLINRDLNIEKIGGLIEKNLTLVGASALEDKCILF